MRLSPERRNRRYRLRDAERIAERSGLPARVPAVQTWIINAEHSIETWYESTDSGAIYCARCSCGWHSASGSGALRNWNVDGHAQPILKAAELS